VAKIPTRSPYPIREHVRDLTRGTAQYKEAPGPLDEAVKVAAKSRDAAYPSIATTAKIEALSGIGQND
jgi:hypothetical protein